MEGGVPSQPIEVEDIPKKELLIPIFAPSYLRSFCRSNGNRYGGNEAKKGKSER